MLDKQKKDYLRFNHNLTGKGYVAHIIDVNNEDVNWHGDMSVGLWKDDRMCTEAEIIYHSKDRRNVLASLREIWQHYLETGKRGVIAISMHGFKLDTDDSKYYYDKLKEVFVIVCAMGNNGMWVTNFPAAHDDTLAISASYFDNGRPSYYRLSTIGNYVSFNMLSGFDVYTEAVKKEQEYTATSCATQVAGNFALKIIEWWDKSYDRDWRPKDIASVIFNICEDMFDKGFDPYTGYGLPRLPEVLEFKWYEMHKQFLKVRKGVTYSKPCGEFATRADQIIYLAQADGYSGQGKYNPNSCRVYLENKYGFEIGRKVGDDIVFDFYEPLTRGEHFAFIAKYEASKRGDDVKFTGDTWDMDAINYLIDNGYCIFDLARNKDSVLVESVIKMTALATGYIVYD